VAINGYAPSSVKDIPDILGVPAADTHAALQQDAFKELVNKLAWAIGSTYRTPFSNTRTATRQLACRIASRMIVQQGYPAKIAIVKGS